MLYRTRVRRKNANSDIMPVQKNILLFSCCIKYFLQFIKTFDSISGQLSPFSPNTYMADSFSIVISTRLYFHYYL